MSRRSGLSCVPAALGLLLVGLSVAASAGEERPEGRKLDPARLQLELQFIAKLSNNMEAAEIGGHRLDVHCPKLPAEASERWRMEKLERGIVTLDNGSAIKLRSEVDLRFGELTLAAGNFAPGYPGLYSLWLRKAGDGGWRLVANSEPDVGGSMHDPQADVGEIPLVYEHLPEQASELRISIEETGDRGGSLVLSWGPHRWQAPFTVGG